MATKEMPLRVLCELCGSRLFPVSFAVEVASEFHRRRQISGALSRYFSGTCKDCQGISVLYLTFFGSCSISSATGRELVGSAFLFFFFFAVCVAPGGFARVEGLSRQRFFAKADSAGCGPAWLRWPAAWRT
jgi:hypothetical protein